MRLCGFVCYLHQHFLQGEKFPVVLLHTSHTHFSHSLILWVFPWSGHRYIGSKLSFFFFFFCLYIGKLFFHFSVTSSPALSQCHLFHNCFCQQNVFCSLSAFHIGIHALRLDWEDSGAGTVSGLACVYVYLSSKSPSSEPQSPVTVTNASVGEKALTY